MSRGGKITQFDLFGAAVVYNGPHKKPLLSKKKYLYNKEAKLTVIEANDEFLRRAALTGYNFAGQEIKRL